MIAAATHGIMSSLATDPAGHRGQSVIEDTATARWWADLEFGVM
jgi:hypothetical protein